MTTNYHLRPLTFFASIGRPLERYFTEVIRAQGETIEAELWMEAEERLGQLDFLIDRIEELQNGAAARFSSPARVEVEGLSALRNDFSFELKLSAEAFYYFAARLVSILQRFPHLKNFDAPGVRNVRNHLIEHSDKASSGVTQQNWSFGGEGGPAFKNIRRPDQERVPMDRGLLINAAELRDNLERKLIIAIESIPPFT